MRFEDAHQRLATAARYRDLARYTFDASTRVALIETAAQFEREACAAFSSTKNVSGGFV